MTATLDRHPHLIGYGLALGAAAAVGFTPVASKVLLGHMHVLTFGVIWFGCAALFALLTLLAQGRGRTLVLRGRVFAAAAGVGITNGLAGALFFRAVQLTDPALVAFFSRPGTILVVLAGVIFFHERLARLEWLGIAIVVLGSGLMGVVSSAIQLQAFVLVILNSVLLSVSMTLAKAAVASVPPLVLVAYRACFTSATFGVMSLAVGAWEFPLGGYLWALPVGAFCGPFFSFVLLYAAFTRLSMSRASVVHSAYPLFTTLYGWLLLGAGWVPVQLMGGLLATGGIGLLVARHPQAVRVADAPTAK